VLPVFPAVLVLVDWLLLDFLMLPVLSTDSSELLQVSVVLSLRSKIVT
jgi:hypothetical protein